LPLNQNYLYGITSTEFREIVFQILYSYDFIPGEDEEMIPFMMNELKVTKRVMIEAHDRMRAVLAKQEEIDAIISKASTEYTFERISRVEKTILRLSLFELLLTPPYRSDCDCRTIRLCRKFGTPESAQFINAILDGSTNNAMSLKFQNQRLLSEFSTFGIGVLSASLRGLTFVEMEEALQFARDHSLSHLVVGKARTASFLIKAMMGLSFSIKSISANGKIIKSMLGLVITFHSSAFSRRAGVWRLEFASGIPATVGGAIFMNAGANGKETCEAIHSVVYLDETKQEFSRNDLKFGYRRSPFQKMDGAILAATFTLQPNKAARAIQLKIVEGG